MTWQRERLIRWAVFVLVALFGLAVRLPYLGERPMHTDEAVNAYIVGQLLAGKPFTYDPQDRHGPALAAIALPMARVQGARTFSDLAESELRLTPVLAGTITILLFGAATEMFGFAPCLIGALLFACSPLPAYYDRYFIHESIFVASTFGLIVSGWSAWMRRSTWRATLAGACAALMLASKETAVLHFFALASAAFLFWLGTRRRRSACRSWPRNVPLAAAASFLLLSVVFFTWFGTHWSALGELWKAVPDFTARASGEGHQKPLWYFARLLSGGWSGGSICTLAAIGLFQTLKSRDASAYGFLALYTSALFAIYSLIPYKTPWLALNFWLSIALFSGLTFQSMWGMGVSYPGFRVPLRVVGVLIAAGVAVLIAHDTRQRVFLQPADEANPYAYAQTSEDLLGLVPEIERLARQNAIASPHIAVMAADPWPLPWYLRHNPEVGFWQPGEQPGKADFYITSTDAADQYTKMLQDFHADYFGERPGVLILLWSPAPK
jgi:uncharacterized protein (TIGR03663 family)